MDTFPSQILQPFDERWRLTGVTIAGGVPTAGAPGSARTDGGGFWMCWHTGIALDYSVDLKLARKIDGLLDGGSTAMIVPFAAIGAVRPEGAGPNTFVTGRITVAAALRATTLVIQIDNGIFVTGGEPFSINHATRGKRLYEVKTASPVFTGGYQQITIRPPLREAVTGESLDFNTPGSVMRLANPDDWMGAIDATHSSQANPIWVEDLHAA